MISEAIVSGRGRRGSGPNPAARGSDPPGNADPPPRPAARWGRRGHRGGRRVPVRGGVGPPPPDPSVSEPPSLVGDTSSESVATSVKFIREGKDGARRAGDYGPAKFPGNDHAPSPSFSSYALPLRFKRVGVGFRALRDLAPASIAVARAGVARAARAVGCASAGPGVEDLSLALIAGGAAAVVVASLVGDVEGSSVDDCLVERDGIDRGPAVVAGVGAAVASLLALRGASSPRPSEAATSHHPWLDRNSARVADSLSNCLAHLLGHMEVGARWFRDLARATIAGGAAGLVWAAVVANAAVAVAVGVAATLPSALRARWRSRTILCLGLIAALAVSSGAHRWIAGESSFDPNTSGWLRTQFRDRDGPFHHGADEAWGDPLGDVQLGPEGGTVPAKEVRRAEVVDVDGRPLGAPSGGTGGEVRVAFRHRGRYRGRSGPLNARGGARVEDDPPLLLADEDGLGEPVRCEIREERNGRRGWWWPFSAGRDAAAVFEADVVLRGAIVGPSGEEVVVGVVRDGDGNDTGARLRLYLLPTEWDPRRVRVQEGS